MRGSPSNPDSTKQWVIGGVFLLLAGVFLALFVAVGPLPIMEGAGALLGGGLMYLMRTLPNVSFDLELTLHAAVAAALFVIGLHQALRWWIRHQTGAESTWPLPATVKVAGVLSLLFPFSVSVGISRGVGWFIGAPQPSLVALSGKVESEIFGPYHGLVSYADDHEGSFPEALQDLAPKYCVRPELFESENGYPAEPFQYFSGHGATDPPGTILLASAHPFGGLRVVMRWKTGMQLMPELEYRNMVGEQEGVRACW